VASKLQADEAEPNWCQPKPAKWLMAPKLATQLEHDWLQLAGGSSHGLYLKRQT